MAGEWAMSRLGDFVVYQKGFAFKSADYLATGHPIVRVSNFTDRSIDMVECCFLNPDCISQYEAYKLSYRDTVVATVGSWPTNPASVVGKVVCVPKKADGALLNQNAVRLRVRSGMNQRFLFYLLKCLDFQKYIVGTAQGSASQASITLDDIFGFEFRRPSIPEQEIIAHILGTLDDKIELNRRMNETLEAMARAFFKSWFVDFDPVRAKAARRPTGLPKPIGNLFPDSFEDSELGKIPKGWMVCTLGAIAKNVSITFDFDRMREVVFINTGDVLEGDFLHSNRSMHADLPGQAKKSICPDDILFSEIRPANKRYAFVDFDSSDYVVSTKFMIIRGSQDIHPRLLYRILTAKETLEEFQVQAESRSGTFPQITFDSISYLPIVLPTIQVQGAFQQSVDRVDAQIKANKHQISTLTALRDALLPKLLSGKIRVADAEKIMEVGP